MRPLPTLLLFTVLTQVGPANAEAPCDDLARIERQIRVERITGSRVEAEQMARAVIACPDLPPETRLAVRLELATILDRHGLHTNTRPVEEALAHLRAAASDAQGLGPEPRARVELALARYHYRAEMADRRFEQASAHARDARALFEEAQLPAGVRDAVHLLGLVALQQRDPALARELFDESIEWAQRTDPDLLFLGDAHRHVGLVDLQVGEQTAAIEHFAQSHTARSLAGARDHTLFAATTWASALVDAGRAREAEPIVREALELADELSSPVGRLRATLAAAEMREALGDPAQSLDRYRDAVALARALGAGTEAEQAKAAVARLLPVVTGPTATAVDLPPIPFTSDRWTTEAEVAQIETWEGRECLHLKSGSAVLADADFTNGVIEVDVAMPDQRGFMGVMWRAADDGGAEDFYLRPHQSGQPDSVQYTPVSHGVSAWQLYHGSVGGEGYGTAIEHHFDRWTHLRIVVSGDRADIYVDSVEPILSAPLVRPPRSGALVLHTAFAPARFADLKVRSMDAPSIRPSSPEARAAAQAAAATPSHLLDWEVSSAFPADRLRSSRLETALLGELTWDAVTADRTGLVDLALLRTRDQGDTVIARHELAVERAETALLAFGYSDRVRVYLDGRLLYSGDNGYRTRDFRYLGTIGLFDRAVLELTPGPHELALAVSESFGGWGLVATLEPMEAAPGR